MFYGKKLLWVVFAIVTLAFLPACGGGGGGGKTPDINDDGLGSLTYQESTSELRNFYFEEFSSEGNTINIDLFFSSSSSITDDGRYVYLEMYFTGDSVSPGTYTWSATKSAGTFSDFSDITIVTNGEAVHHKILSGTVTIEKDGDVYTVSGNFVTALSVNTENSFYFSGSRSLYPWQE